MSVETVLNISLWVFSIAGYIIYNLYQKNARLEKLLQDHNEFLINLQAIVEESDRRLADMDRRGIFQSDDEIGTFFKMITELQKMLNQFFGR